MGGGAGKAKFKEILTHTASFAAICGFLYQVLKPLFTGQARDEVRPDGEYQLQVLGIMLLLGFSKMLDEDEHIPMTVVQLPELVEA